jgi:hypothetical protein
MRDHFHKSLSEWRKMAALAKDSDLTKYLAQFTDRDESFVLHPVDDERSTGEHAVVTPALLSKDDWAILEREQSKMLHSWRRDHRAHSLDLITRNMDGWSEEDA